jgi:hypothetical protein
MHQVPKLRLTKSRKLYRSLKTPYLGINFLIYGFVYWLEDRVIEYKTKSAIDVALIRLKTELPPEPDNPWVPPEVSEVYEDPEIPLPTLRSRYRWAESKDEQK